MNYMDRYPVFKRGIYWFWESWTERNGVIPVPLEYSEDGKENGPGWVIKQSKVATGKFLGFDDDKDMGKT